MSAPETTDDGPIVQSPSLAPQSPRSTLATASLVTGILAAVFSIAWVLLPLLAVAMPLGDGWSPLGFGILNFLGLKALTGLFAIVAVITGVIALRRLVGRARAGAGIALGAVLLAQVVIETAMLVPTLSP